ncbi:hypothetical protein [Natronomonas sp. LN261]|jgi:hypothetical protein|uniref:DUF7847 domain-containing protein n=1 Tax=Natronomonas sp. LN261 TaxID=2750669 RepID=UPI0015EF3346|nr:hypothetical protein [Natronomonas sp. LN261]
MAALNSLHPAVRALIRNPILIVIVGLYGLVQLPQLALQPTQPIVAAIISLGITGLMLVVMPFFQGGLLGMADEALNGQTSLGTLVSEGKTNYIRLLLAYLALFAVNLIFGFIAFIVVLLGGVGLFAGDSRPGLAALGAIAVVGILFALAYLLVIFFIQFYAHAIVLTDTTLVDGFKRSVSLVRQNIVSTLGYTLILLVGSLVFGGIGSIASLLLSPQATELPLPDVSMPVLAGAAIVYVVALAILGAFYATYSVAFYRSIEQKMPC